MRKLIAIIGPTAAGKTDLAIELALRYSGEVVNADSRQVYRFMDIGTAKPTPQQQATAPHHLIDIIDPNERFNLAEYQEMAYWALEEIWSRGKTPLLVGGTGQYIWAVLEGWNVPRVAPDADLRRKLEERASMIGAQALWQELATVDPTAAEKIHPRNIRRVVRALEVYQRTGRPLSACQTRTPPGCDALIIGLTCPREELYRQIDARVDKMIEAGLVDEVRGLLAEGYDCYLPSMASIGYREICHYLSGEVTLEQATERIKTESHRLVRHQYAWFKPGDERIDWIESGDNALNRATILVERFIMSDRIKSEQSAKR